MGMIRNKFFIFSSGLTKIDSKFKKLNYIKTNSIKIESLNSYIVNSLEKNLLRGISESRKKFKKITNLYDENCQSLDTKLEYISKNSLNKKIVLKPYLSGILEKKNFIETLRSCCKYKN